MKILLDHSVPRPLKHYLAEHLADTAAERGWDELHNGELLERAESEGYELLVTADQQMPFQQNFTHRRIKLLILTTNSWPTLSRHLQEINQAGNDPELPQMKLLNIP